MTSNPDQFHNLLRSALAQAPRCRRLVVALSGGVDSVSLAHALVQLARQGGIEQNLQALHVHHGLHVAAGQWQQFCQALCADLQLPLTTRRVHVASAGSVENAARDARYQAFAEFLVPGDLLLLAHHSDDQLETLLLRLMRGAGVHGLRGMPPVRTLGAGWLYRPLLACSRQQLEAYARTAGLSWIADSSNLELQHDRNFLRHQVLPLLARRWPGYRQAWGKSRLLLAEASDTLTELAEQDLQAAGLADNRLALATLSRLSDFRLRNALRHWLRRLGVQPPGWQQLCVAARMVRDNPDNEPQNRKGLLLQGADYRLQTWDGYLFALRTPLPFATAIVPLHLQLDSTFNLPGNGKLWLKPAHGEGISPRFARAEVRFRRGGEQLHLAGRPDKSLKKLFQEHRIPPWVRSRTPLLFIDDTLAWVAGIGIAEFAHAGPDETGTELQWQPPQLLLQP